MRPLHRKLGGCQRHRSHARHGTSPTAPGVTHRWTNLRAYADEVSAARIAAGFHYRFSTVVGEEMGRQIGVHAAKTIMQPLGSTSAR
jgi:hypothetical protein